MFMCLLKKQLMEVFSWLFKERKSGKIRSRMGVIGFGALYLVLLFIVGGVFYQVADLICGQFYQAGLIWLYFAFMALFSVFFSIVGSVFSTYTTVYQAKDNDLLLSMPIPPRYILIVRLLSVYLLGLIFELLVYVPTIIVYFVTVKVSLLGIIFTCISPFILGLLSLSLSCLLGWIIALIGSKVKRKNLITMVISIAFFIAYYWFFSQANQLVGEIVLNAQLYNSTAKNYLYPFYHLGLASGGNVLSFLIFTAIMVGLFAVVFFVLSKSFIKLATAKAGGPKTKYKEKKFRHGSKNGALLRRELKRFVSSPIYMLNSGIGLVILMVVAVLLAIKSSDFIDLFLMLMKKEEILLLLVGAGIVFTGTSTTTSPSVSLEGKNIWIVQSMPVSAKSVLMAKLKMHVILNAIPMLFYILVLEIVFTPTFLLAVLIVIASLAFIVFSGSLGLMLNLKMPDLTWTNENVPIKQGMPVLICMLGMMVLPVLFVVLYLVLAEYLTATLFMLLVCVAITAIDALLLYWINNKGALIFEKL